MREGAVFGKQLEDGRFIEVFPQLFNAVLKISVDDTSSYSLDNW